MQLLFWLEDDSFLRCLSPPPLSLPSLSKFFQNILDFFYSVSIMSRFTDLQNNRRMLVKYVL